MAFKHPRSIFFFVEVLILWLQIEAKPEVNVKVKVNVNGKRVIEVGHPNNIDGKLRIIISRKLLVK